MGCCRHYREMCVYAVDSKYLERTRRALEGEISQIETHNGVTAAKRTRGGRVESAQTHGAEKERKSLPVTADRSVSSCEANSSLAQKKDKIFHDFAFFSDGGPTVQISSQTNGSDPPTNLIQFHHNSRPRKMIPSNNSRSDPSARTRDAWAPGTQPPIHDYSDICIRAPQISLIEPLLTPSITSDETR